MSQPTNHSTTVPGTPGQPAESAATVRAYIHACQRDGERDLRPEVIAAAVRMRGTTLAAMSRRRGLNRNAFQQALRGGRHRSRPIEQALARFLGVTPRMLWPERYPTAQRVVLVATPLKTRSHGSLCSTLYSSQECLHLFLK